MAKDLSIKSVARACLSVELAADGGGVYRVEMKSSDLIREIEAEGWVLNRVRGSHHVFYHPVRTGHVVVPNPKKDLGPGLVRAIRRQAKAGGQDALPDRD